MTVPGKDGLLGSFASNPGGHIVIARKTFFDQNQTEAAPPNTPPVNANSGPSPSTAVAMIILYSITGVITALFLVIIITGAVRAHRHPERYGPRNALGRPRQSRARGLARAMLDTLPIVKFGEKEEVKPPQDVEMSGGQTTASKDATTPAVTTRDGESVQESVLAHETPSSAADIQPSDHEDARPTPDSTGSLRRHDLGLGCSICTDDFELGQDVRVLPCDHSFHPACIDPWLLNVSGTCPLW
jgi:hypothetical protein